jgi:hypothetical protein
MPRFGTPRNLARATYGHEVGEVARRLGKPLMPWQQHAADVALEIDPATGDLWYEEVDITVPRQSGKTTLILALLVWRCIRMAHLLGPQTTTYLAQSGKMARRKLEREFIPTLRRARSLQEVPHNRARPVKANEWKPSMNNGSEHVLFGSGSYLQIDAPTEKGGHGDVLDMPVIDEAFAHAGDSVEQAVDAASITRRSPQLYVVSTAGNGRSFYLWGKVRGGRAAVEEGRESRICYLEWSVPDDIDPTDEDAWVTYLPALGHTIPLERLRAKLEKAMRNPDLAEEDGDDPGMAGFQRAYLNQWVDIPSQGVAGRPVKLPAAEWAASANDRKPPMAPGNVTVAFDVAIDGAWSSIAVGGGSLAAPYVEVIEHRQGVGWLPARLVELVEKWTPSEVGCNGAGAASAQVGAVSLALAEAGSKATVRQLNASEWKAACGGLYTDVVEGRLCRPTVAQGPLDVAAGDAAERVLGDGFAWDARQATVPLSPLGAVTAARALLPDAVDPRSIYGQERGLITL